MLFSFFCISIFVIVLRGYSPKGKLPYVRWKNKVGKSNIIHALRHAFLSKVIKPRQTCRYDELKRVAATEVDNGRQSVAEVDILNLLGSKPRRPDT